MMIRENSRFKTISSENFNMYFNKVSGVTMTYGKTVSEDPEFCPLGPVIADFEVSTICSHNCAFCYKDNTPSGSNMSFDMFRTIFHKLPRTLTQIAFGIGDINANPDLKRIMSYCRDNDYQHVIPNITINGDGMTDDWYEYLTKTCGAIAVSYYDKETCFNTVEHITGMGFRQVNIHALLSDETFDQCMELVDLIGSDHRLQKLYYVVFLMLKKKGRGEIMTRVPEDKYAHFMGKLLESGVRFGFDSCGAGRLIDYLKDERRSDLSMSSIEPCESGLFSIYVNAKGRFFPCSFAEGLPGWEEGIDLMTTDNFLTDVWLSEKVNILRDTLLCNGRRCPNYNI